MGRVLNGKGLGSDLEPLKFVLGDNGVWVWKRISSCRIVSFVQRSWLSILICGPVDQFFVSFFLTLQLQQLQTCIQLQFFSRLHLSMKHGYGSFPHRSAVALVNSDFISVQEVVLYLSWVF